MEIREATLADMDHVIPLVHGFVSADEPSLVGQEAAIAEALIVTPGGCLLLALHSGYPIGCLYLRRTGVSQAVAGYFYMRPFGTPYRAGVEMMSRACEWCMAQGITEVQAWVSESNMDRATYRRIGFLPKKTLLVGDVDAILKEVG